MRVWKSTIFPQKWRKEWFYLVFPWNVMGLKFSVTTQVNSRQYDTFQNCVGGDSELAKKFQVVSPNTIWRNWCEKIRWGGGRGFPPSKRFLDKIFSRQYFNFGVSAETFLGESGFFGYHCRNFWQPWFLALICPFLRLFLSSSRFLR